MSDRFCNYFEWLMRWEGERYENDPDDPGGETKFGIDKRSHQTVDVKNLTREEAKAIYKRDYWDAMHADELPPGISLMVVDIRVNGGKPVLWLQEALGVTVDGILGPNTIAAAQLANKHAVIRALAERRRNYHCSLAEHNRNLKKFLTGWLNRDRDLERFIYEGAETE